MTLPSLFHLLSCDPFSLLLLLSFFFPVTSKVIYNPLLLFSLPYIYLFLDFPLLSWFLALLSSFSIFSFSPFLCFTLLTFFPFSFSQKHEATEDIFWNGTLYVIQNKTFKLNHSSVCKLPLVESNHSLYPSLKFTSTVKSFSPFLGKMFAFLSAPQITVCTVLF